MQMPVSLTNQRQRIRRLLVSLRPANAANTDEGLEHDFIMVTLKKKRERKGKECGGRKKKKREWEMEINVCENMGLYSALYQLQISN